MTDHNISEEDKYFKKKDAELKKKKHEEMECQRRDEIKDMHYMHCPKCGCDLQSVEKFHVELDFCPSCNGVWFDQGELDRVIDLEIDDRKNIFKKIKKLFD